MNHRMLVTLIVANVVLLGGLLLSVLTEPVHGQVTGRRGDFVMVAGTAAGRSNQQVAYLLDLRSNRMAALLVTTGDSQIQVLDIRDLEQDAQLRMRR
jgi:hypothetical protein